MTPEFTSLVAASLTFVGTHFALSHPLRAPLVGRFGAAGFQGLYSVVALAAMAWMVLAFRAMPPAAPLWNGMSDALWIIASLLTLLASVLLVGSFFGNPALADPRAQANAAKPAHGVFHVTRHPMMWAFALWAVSHALISPSPRSLVLTSAMAFLALVGAHLQDRKKQALMGAAWVGWEARTSYWPKLSGLARAGAVPWLGGLVVWLGATWAHMPGNGLVAGVWRWF
jgi:uncharacterized membrane protein